MSTDTAVEVIEVVEEKEEKKTRGRKAAPKKNYKRIFSNADNCDANPPLDDKDMPVDGFRAYKVVVTSEVNFAKGTEFFVHARSGDQASSFIIGNYVDSQPLHEQQRGPSKKIDENYLKYCHLMHNAGMTDGLNEFFKEFPHYEKIDFSKPVDELIQEYCSKK
ncbi:MAG: hypothetical protein IPM51_11740 [Sphingobacteriaceae bacterium]|nr:hypothetical protein [Sphingobacteriaceae bacterium]